MVLVISLAVGAVALVAVGPTVRPALAPVALAAAVVVLMLVPALASIATAAEAHTGALPTAVPQDTVSGRGGARFGPGGGEGALPRNGQAAGGFGRPGSDGFGAGGFGPGNFGPGQGRGGLGGLLDAASASPALDSALQANADQYTWTAATTGSNNAAGLALSSATSVMAIGGFNGSDPTPTLSQFQAYVAEGRIHYYVATQDAAGFRGTRGGPDVAADIAAWVAGT